MANASRLTPEAKQTIIELLAQVARQNGAERVEVGVDGTAPYQEFRVSAYFGNAMLGFSVDWQRWRQDTCTATTDPAYARILDLWSQIVAAAKAMEEAE